MQDTHWAHGGCRPVTCTGGGYRKWGLGGVGETGAWRWRRAAWGERRGRRRGIES